MITNSTQREILSNCSFFPKGARYSEMKPKPTAEANSQALENDLYNYHLQQLVKNGYLDKSGELYVLTQQGKSIVTNIDETTKTIATNYKVSVYVCPVVDGRVLLYKRLKHPQYGYTGLISGKMKYGENILSTARRELKEETGLDADLKIIGNLRQIRKDANGNVIEDGIFYICYTDAVVGSLVEKSLEGEYFWVELDKVSSLEKIFKPSLEIVVKEVTLRLNAKTSWESKFIYELMPEPEDY